jgi:hypothetical protein
MKRKLKILAVVILSTGWIVPAFNTLYYLLSWLDDEVSDVLHGNKSMYSFDFILHLDRWSKLTFIWFAIAVLFWTIVGSCRLFPKEPCRMPSQEDAPDPKAVRSPTPLSEESQDV